MTVIARHRQRLLAFADHLNAMSLSWPKLTDQQQTKPIDDAFPNDIRFLRSIMSSEATGVAYFFGQTVSVFDSVWLGLSDDVSEVIYFPMSEAQYEKLKYEQPVLLDTLAKLYASTSTREIATNLRAYVDAFLPEDKETIKAKLTETWTECYKVTIGHKKGYQRRLAELNDWDTNGHDVEEKKQALTNLINQS